MKQIHNLILHIFETLYNIHIFCLEDTLISLIIELFLCMPFIHHYHYTLLYPHFYSYSESLSSTFLISCLLL